MLDLEPIKTRVDAGAKALAVAGNVVLRNDDGHEGNPLDAWTRQLIANAPADLAALVAEVERLRDDERQAAGKQPKFASGDAVTVLKPQAVLAPPFTRLPGTVVRVGSFDALANAWDYLVKTEQGEIWGTCNTVRPSPRTEGGTDG
jgi:hypothetical protein